MKPDVSRLTPEQLAEWQRDYAPRYGSGRYRNTAPEVPDDGTLVELRPLVPIRHKRKPRPRGKSRRRLLQANYRPEE
jgi:hypothetical protein